MSPENAGIVEPPPQGMSEVSRLTGVFFEPRKTFEDVAARPTWVIPMVISIIFGMIFCVIVGQRIGWDTIAQQQVEQRMAKMTPEQRQNAGAGMEMSKKITPIIAYASALFAPAIMYLVVGAVLLGIVAGLMSAPIKFKQIFAIECYAGMLGVVQAILMVVVVFLKASPADFDIRHPLMFNAGVFLDQNTTSPFVYALATALDVFTFWRILLLAIGLKAAGGKKLSFGGALTAVVGPWIVIVLIGATFAGIFG